MEIDSRPLPFALVDRFLGDAKRLLGDLRFRRADIRVFFTSEVICWYS
jgi:hypothetical protein